MEYHNILRFLFVGGLATNLTVGGLGVEGQHNVLCMIYFRRKEESTNKNREHLMN
jgi:hypothetical protein